MAFFTQNKTMQKLDHNIDFWEKRLFFAENCRKSPKIGIITSTPDINQHMYVCSVAFSINNVAWIKDSTLPM
jgi:hypothetical protein